MATYNLGHIEPFDFEDDWHSYTERVQQFFVANKFTDEKQMVATFITIMGAKCYNLLRNLIVSGKPSDKKFSEFVQILGKHLKPQPVVIAERFKVYKRIQREDESVVDVMAALRKLSEHCQFGDFLDQALRDMLGCGLKNTAAQKRLLAEAKLELNKALEIALSMEMAEKQALAMKTDVHNVDPEVKLLKVDRCRTGKRRAAPTTGNSAGNYRPKGLDGG